MFVTSILGVDFFAVVNLNVSKLKNPTNRVGNQIYIQTRSNWFQSLFYFVFIKNVGSSALATHLSEQARFTSKIVHGFKSGAVFHFNRIVP